MITRFNERWIVLGDITNSTLFFHLLDKITNGKTSDNHLLFDVTHTFNSAIESMYRDVEVAKPENASLGNTMGDGFLVVGFAGHGSSHIKYEFAPTLLMCLQVKRETDKRLAKVRKEICEKIRAILGVNACLPDLKLKLCVHFGYVLTSVGFNRYIGNCINYSARIVSSAFKEKSTNVLVLTDKYFQLLPEDLRKCVSDSKLPEEIELRKYFDKDESALVVIWRIPFDHKDFWRTVGQYRSYYDPTKDMEFLREKLYSRKK